VKSKFWAVGVACLLLFCAAPASAFAGSISGTVTNAATGLPMSGVTACAEGVGSGGYCVGVGGSGEYTITGLETAEYRVRFQPDFESNYVRPYYPGTLYYEDATLISLDSSEDVTEINAVIQEGATLTGTIVGEGATGPVEGIEVCARETAGAGYSFCEQTESDGTYRIVGVPADSYKITFESGSAEGEYATRYYDEKAFEDEAEEVELESGQEFTADATVGRAGAIEGAVTEAGAPLQWAWVCVYTLGKHEIGCSSAGEEGRYRYEGLPVGSYILEVEYFGEPRQFSGGAKTIDEATPVTVEAERTTIEDFEIAGPPGISGTVLDGSTGEAPKGAVNACASSEHGTNCFQIEADGSYEILGIEPGEYLVYFEGGNYIRQFYDGVSDERDATLVTVGESMVTGIDAELQSAGALTGHITLAGAGTNLGSVNACALALSGTVVECGTSSSSTGNYTIRELPPGEYKVRFSKSGYGTQYYNGKATIAEAEPVTVTGGNTTSGIDAAMAATPKNTAKPQLSGVGRVGEVLSCSQGTWTGSPSLYEYFWFRNNAEIEGAEASTYTVAPADAGKTIRCGVVAENAAGGTFAESSNSLKIPSARHLGITKGGSGSGTVTSNPAGIDCGQTCSIGAYQGDVFTLTAVPSAHSEFTGWSGGGCSGSGVCTVTLESDTAVTAEFAKVTHGVSVAVTGGGSVGADSGAITGCTESDGTCSGTYDEGVEVTLTATPDAHHTFTGWTGCTAVTGDECLVTVEGAEDVSASFAPIVHQVTAAKAGDGSGAVTSSPAGIECGPTCAARFDEGTTVTLTAVADPGSEFTGWSGGVCSGTGPCLVTVGEDTHVVANFAAKPNDGGSNRGTSDGGSNQQTPPSSSGSTNSLPAPAPKHASKKPLQCKKGFHKLKQKDKARCVKAKPNVKKAKGNRG
jgi:Carboxypeptidase regulatory-like domain/Divergent InlB B-repeat domain